VGVRDAMVGNGVARVAVNGIAWYIMSVGVVTGRLFTHSLYAATGRGITLWRWG